MGFSGRAIACFLIGAFTWCALPQPSKAGWADDLRAGVDAIVAQPGWRERTERAIVLGGVLLYRHRHAVAGAAIGCAMGSVAATTAAASASLVTGGASLSTAAPAAAIGCGLGALSGASMGNKLDNVYDDQAEEGS